VYADQEDVARFVHCRIARSTHSTMYKMAREDKELESNIQTTIEKKADGMCVRRSLIHSLANFYRFLMAKLLMELLARPNHMTKNSFRDQLRNLPDAPEDAYRQLWRRILGQEEQHALLAQHIFSWVTFSEQPLTVKDLQYALHLETDPQALPFDPDDLTLEEKLGSVCLGVIAVKPKTSVIAFVHHTAKLFFPTFLTSEFAIEAQRRIAISCMRYMKLLGRLRYYSLPKSHPLLFYAGVHWATHVAKIHPSLILDDVVSFLLDDEGLRGAATLLQQFLWIDSESMFRTRAPVIKDITPLHVAAYFGLIDVARRLLSGAYELIDHTGDDYWTALRWAVINRQSAMVLYLTTQGAELELTDNEGNDILMWALGHDHDLSRLADINIHGCSFHIGDTFLYSSFERMARYNDVVIPDARTSTEILHFLVLNTVSINARNVAGRTSLTIAAKHRHLDILGHLLQKGANVNTADERDMTALLWALQSSSATVLENINVHGQACVHIGPHIIIDSSLPEDFNSGDIISGLSSYESMLIQLVGIDLDTKDHDGRTALSLAAGKGLSTLVATLLQRGADVTTVDDKNLTAYEWAFFQPAPHRTHIRNVTVDDSSDVFIGAQFQYRDLDLPSVRSVPEMDGPRALISETLLEHMRVRGAKPTELREHNCYDSEASNDIDFISRYYQVSGISALDGARTHATISDFAFFDGNCGGMCRIGSRASDWKPPTQSWHTDITFPGSSRGKMGVAGKVSCTQAPTSKIPLT
jgi:ankyrin repeat protein